MILMNINRNRNFYIFILQIMEFNLHFKNRISFLNCLTKLDQKYSLKENWLIENNLLLQHKFKELLREKFVEIGVK